MGGKEDEGKASRGRKRWISLGKTNDFLGEQMRDKKVCDNVCFCGASLLPVLAIKLP